MQKFIKRRNVLRFIGGAAVCGQGRTRLARCNRTLSALVDYGKAFIQQWALKGSGIPEGMSKLAISSACSSPQPF